MDQLEKLRLEKHKEYLRRTKLPQFFEKYKKYFTSEYKAAKIITSFVKKNYLHEVVNPEALSYIPGIYRMRIKLSDSNLVQPLPPIPIKYEGPLPHIPINHQEVEVNNDILRALKKSEKEYDEKYNSELTEAMKESIKLNDNLDYEDMVLNQALYESLVPSKKLQVEQVIFNDTYFYFCVDLREFGPHPNNEIFIENIPYYLHDKQIEKVTKNWRKINPSTTTGLVFQQNLSYYKSLTHDMK
jgi:hypothetical protein